MRAPESNPTNALASVLAALAVAWSLAACTPPDELDADDLGDSFDWEEILGKDAGGDGPDLGKAGRGTPRPPAVDAMLLTPERLALLPPLLRQKPVLARLAVSRGLENPIDYQGGVYGLLGPAKMFVSTREHIKDDVRLYWVMVKVLSEKYGCFMVAKVNERDRTRVTCRDKRQIVFWPSHGNGWVQFLTRQYDAHGYEIVVRKRQIVRISKERMI